VPSFLWLEEPKITLIRTAAANSFQAEMREPFLADRIRALRNLFSPQMDGYIIVNDKNMLYFTGFSGGSRLLIPPSRGEVTFFVNSVNYEAAKEKAKNVNVELVNIGEDADRKLTEEISRLKLRHIGFDVLRASTYIKLKEQLKEAKLEPAEEIVWSLRKVKNQEEVALAKKAAELTSRGMNKAFEVVAAGMKEREVAAEIECEMRRLGSDGVAFETIVGSGPNSAFPHGGCGDRKIERGDFVTIDVGAKYRDYCADLTRTFIIGEPSPRCAEIYETVREAQELAFNQIGVGVETKKVDGAAREYIEKKGYGKYFVHSVGHGVGLDIHEPPTLGPSSKDVLSSGNIVTVEPGIYVPKLGGVRIEDTVLVLEDGAKKLTEAPIPHSL